MKKIVSIAITASLLVLLVGCSQFRLNSFIDANNTFAKDSQKVTDLVSEAMKNSSSTDELKTELASIETKDSYVKMLEDVSEIKEFKMRGVPNNVEKDVKSVQSSVVLFGSSMEKLVGLGSSGKSNAELESELTTILADLNKAIESQNKHIAIINKSRE